MKKRITVVTLIIVLVMIFACLGAFAYHKYFKKSEKVIEEPTIEVKNTIEDYGYTLEDRDTELFESTFNRLKELLNQEEYASDDYISLISQLFIIDLYTINNKISRYDIGGLEYVYPDALESFKTVVDNSIYKTVENNVDDTRTQSLPEVKDITVTLIEPYSYKMPDETTVEGYKVKLSWEYKIDLGYDSTATLILIPQEKGYGVVFINPRV